MIRTLSLAAALAILPLSSASAIDDPTSAEVALEAAASRFEARMVSFGERAEAIESDESLSEREREVRVARLWSEYQPDVTAFTESASLHAASIAAEVLAEVDIDALVAQAVSDADIEAEVERALAEADIEGVIEQALAGLETIESETEMDAD